MKRFLCLASLLTFTCLVLGQYPEIYFERITDKQGLFDQRTHCILQDKTGFMWFGGVNGLYKYDGYYCTYFKYPPGCSNCAPFGNVVSLQEDGFGNIWILTGDALVLFDPEMERSRIIHRHHSPAIFQNASLNFGFDLLIDKEGTVWCTDTIGLLKISYKSGIEKEGIYGNNNPENIFSITHIDFSSDRLSNKNVVHAIYEDNNGNIWIGCRDGLYFVRKGDSLFYDLSLAGRSLSPSTGFLVSDILQYNSDTFLLVGSRDFVMQNVRKALNTNKPDMKALVLEEIKYYHEGPWLFRFYKDRYNNTWLVGIRGPFLVQSIDKNSRISCKNSYENLVDQHGNKINQGLFCLYMDRTTLLWAGHQYNGILKFNPGRSNFISYKNLISKTFTNLDINPIFKDDKDNIWIGAYNGGIYKIDEIKSRVRKFDPGFTKNLIVSFEEISSNIFWIGLQEGVLEFNGQTGKYTDPFPDSEVKQILMTGNVWDILKDGNQMYMATSGGLFVYDLKAKKLHRFTYQKQFVENVLDFGDIFRSLIRLKNGEVLVGNANHGISKVIFNVDNGEILLTQVIADSLLKIKNINLRDRFRLFQDSKGILWLVNKKGLFNIDPKTKEIIRYNLLETNEFPEPRSILEDNRSNLWMGTMFGLCKFDRKTGKVRCFTREDGLPITIHGYNSAFKDKDGRLYFGGMGGFYSFHPDSIRTNNYIPPIVITDFQLFNKSVRVDTSEKGILNRNISFTKIIDLAHDQNDIAFTFAALDYNQPLRNQYAYKLEGYQDAWIETDAGNRIAKYTNLDPGTYLFRVKGSNNDGVWNEEGAYITIIIHKPWYGTILAWCIYVLVFMGLVGGFIFWRLSQLKKEKAELEMQVRVRTHQLEEQKEEILSQRDLLTHQNQQITEHEQLKNRFFTNVSHEFRTPLSLIQSPVEELLDDPRRNEKERRKLNMVQRNVRRLLNLVNQLLDISKLDGSKMKLGMVEADVMHHLRAIAGAFNSLAETKSIAFTMNFPVHEIKSWYDPDKLEKIAGNLLSNAFKFSSEGDKVVFSAKYRNSADIRIDRYLEFSVRDTGPGIPASSLEKVFDRFYQVEQSLTTEFGGTGIGLSLARDMARLQHGDISVESEPGKGSTFTVSLPLGKSHLKESEYYLLEGTLETVTYVPEIPVKTDESLSIPVVSQADGRPLLLIVEDNRDIRLQLTDNFEREYIITEAIDGLAGLKKALEVIPDLVITDLMMPNMDGIELCDKLKNHELTSHIPVIMLTAKVTLEDKVTGFLSGADDYIIKPFQMPELKARVANLIGQRKKLRERFSREVTLEPSEISITPLDEQFMKRAIETVENHISDEGFDLTGFKEAMHMSRSTLFRKLHALTDQSPTEFIRTIRLKRSASLLKQHFGNVTQISLEVGFNNLSYFNRSFKKMYGVSPVEYVKQQ